MTEIFDFNHIIDRTGTDSIKWLKYADRDIIPMWVADMDFLSPPAVMAALHRRIDHGVFGYAAPRKALVETVMSLLESNYSWRIDPEWLVWLPGLVSGINIACRSVGEPGTGILTTLPIYPPFLSAPKLAGRVLQTTAMTNDHGYWQMDFDDLKTQRETRTALFMHCNPHNPTGRMFTSAEQSALAEICMRHDWVICSDEIHCDLILSPDRRHIPIASMDPEIAARTITLMAPSKTYNIPGLGCAMAIISNDSLRRRFKQTMEGIVPHNNLLGYEAAHAAYAHGQSWLEQVLAYLRLNLNLVASAIRAMPGLAMGLVEATYLAWIDTRDCNIADPVKFFESAGVGLSNGNDFGWPGFVRMNFGCSQLLLKKALDRMAEAIDRRS